MTTTEVLGMTETGIPQSIAAVRVFRMTPRSRIRALVSVALLLCVSRLPAQTRQTQVDTPGGQFPLYVTAEYLGMAGLKTVVRIRLRAPELSMAAAKRGLTSFSG